MHDLSLDDMTGLANLLALVEDLSPLPEAGGGLIGFALQGLTNVNHTLGPEVCRRIIAGMGVSLRAVSEERAALVRAYRLGEVDFALTVPVCDRIVTKCITREVTAHFTQYLNDRSLPVPGLVTAQVLYPSEAADLAAVLVRLQHRLWRAGATPRRGGFPPWVETFVSQLIYHITRTADALRYAHHLAVTDAISGLPNHRACEEALAELIAVSHAESRPFAVLFIDGDNLKEYNETYGYEAGNEMIRGLGRVLKEHLGPQDMVFRWLSGDEFLVVLPRTGIAAALATAERLRSIIEKRFQRRPIPVTVSIGVAVYPLHGRDASQLLHNVTLANSAAKRAGRNRIHVYDGDQAV